MESNWHGRPGAYIGYTGPFKMLMSELSEFMIQTHLFDVIKFWYVIIVIHDGFINEIY